MFSEFNILPEILSAHDLFLSIWQTFYMVYISSFIAIFFGIILGVFLVFTKNSSKILLGLNFIAGFIVNILRSIPFIILMISLIPLTKMLLGTTIGTNAAIVSLSIAAVAFYARIAESAISEVDQGKVEALIAMGASKWHMICKLYLPESLPSLIRGATLTIISLIGYSAMAGAIGGGGLGELAYNLGYLRFNVSVIFITVIFLVILVQLVQVLGDNLSKSKPRGYVIILTSIFLLALSIVMNVLPINKMFSKDLSSDNTYLKFIKVGVMSGPEGALYEASKKYAKDNYKLDINFIIFDDYASPNRSLNNGEIDANIFQHVPYLNADIKAHGYDLAVVGKTFNYPIGFYSKKIKKLSQLPNGALVIVASDPTTGGRELLLLQKTGLIKLNPKAGLLATPNDIIYNPKHLKFRMLEAAMLPRALDDAYLVAINTSFLTHVGLKLKDAVIIEGADSPYANIIVVRKSDKDKKWVKDLVDSVHSKKVVSDAAKYFPEGEAELAWKQ